MNRFSIYILFTLLGSLAAYAQPRFVPDTDIKKVGEVEFQQPKRFTIGFTNKGDKPLQILHVNPSCDCVEAAFPQNPIPAGSRGEISFTYEAKLLGTFYRDVEVITNATPDTTYIALQGTVVTEIQDYSDDYPIDLGSVRLMTNTIEFDDVNMGDAPTAELKVLNTDRTAYHPELMHLPPFLSAEYLPENIPAGKQGTIRLTLNSEKLDQMGLNKTSVYLSRYMGDKIGETNEILIEAILLPAFPDMSEEALAKAPELSIPESTADLGAMNGKKELKRTFYLANNGKSDLHLRQVQVFNKALTVSISDRTIQPGKVAKLKIGVVGKYLGKSKGRMRVLLITDDPRHAKQFINIDVKP